MRPYNFVIPEIVYDESSSYYSEFNAKYPLILEKILSEKNYLYGMGNNQKEDLFLVTQTLAEKENGNCIVFRLVFGGSENLPLRALSYPIPVFKLCDELYNTSRNFIIEIIHMNHMSSITNMLDISQVQSSSYYLQQRIEFIIKNNFPRLLDHVFFFEDSADTIEACKSTYDYERVQATLESLLSPEFKDALYKKIEKYPSVLEYIHAHDVVHTQAHVPGLQILSSRAHTKNIAGIINVGGKQEEFFYEARSSIRDTTNNNGDTLPNVQLFTKHHTPPYYIIGNEPKLKDVTHHNGEVPNVVKRDLELLKGLHY